MPAFPGRGAPGIVHRQQGQAGQPTLTVALGRHRRTLCVRWWWAPGGLRSDGFPVAWQPSGVEFRTPNLRINDGRDIVDKTKLVEFLGKENFVTSNRCSPDNGVRPLPGIFVIHACHQ